jgi:hypothetical protein
MLATNIFDTEFHVIDLEMIKGIKGHSNTEWCSVPIIDNTENERELTDSLKYAMVAYPRSQAILVRNHGNFYFLTNRCLCVWGDLVESQNLRRMLRLFILSLRSTQIDGHRS